MKSKLTDSDADEMPRRADRCGHPCASYAGGSGAHNEQGVKPLFVRYLWSSSRIRSLRRARIGKAKSFGGSFSQVSLRQ